MHVLVRDGSFRLAAWFVGPMLLACNAATLTPDASDALGARSTVPLVHRASSAACTPTPSTGSCLGTPGVSSSCSSRADCDAGTNGQCTRTRAGASSCVCTYDSCASDSDCTTPGPCACHDSTFMPAGNFCARGNCRTDSDCGANGYCSPAESDYCGTLAGYYCHTASDECTNDSDCSAGDGAYQQWVCTFDATRAHWSCIATTPCA